MRALTRIGAGIAAVAVLAGCGAGPAPVAPTTPPTPPAPTAPRGEATGGTDAAVCNELKATTPPSVLRQLAEAADRKPILPAAAAIILLGPRQVASTAGARNPELAAAQAELVAAIDDLDAQGRALLGPDGDAGEDAVQLDATRILAAVTEMERVCGG